jgi:hypothetical protein
MDGQTDRRTERTKFIVAFRNFAKAPENHRKFKDDYHVVVSSFTVILPSSTLHKLPYFTSEPKECGASDVCACQMLVLLIL